MLGATVDGLASEHFYRPAHQLIFEAIQALRSAGSPVDPVAVKDELHRGGQLGRIGGGSYLHDCQAAVPTRRTPPSTPGSSVSTPNAAGTSSTPTGSGRPRSAPGADIADIRVLATPPVPAGDDRERGGRKLVLTPRRRSSPSRSSGHGRTTATAAYRPARSACSPAGKAPARLVPDLAGRPGDQGRAPGALKGDPRGVIYVAVEDSWKYTIVPRLMAAGADLTMVYRAEVQAVEGDTVTLSLPSDNSCSRKRSRNDKVAGRARPAHVGDQRHPRHPRQPPGPPGPRPARPDRRPDRLHRSPVSPTSTSPAGTDASSLITARGAFKDVARFIFAFATDDRGRHPGHHPDQEQPRPQQPAIPCLPDHRGHRADREGRGQGRPVRPRRRDRAHRAGHPRRPGRRRRP